MGEAAFQPDWFSKPGDTLSSLMRQRKISAWDLAKSMGCDRQVINGILTGSVQIDGSIADRLSQTVGGSPTFWQRRQATYESSLARAVEAVPKEEAARWIKQFPLRDAAAYGWIERPTRRQDVFKSFLAYFGVSGPQDWHDRYATSFYDFAFRTSPAFESKLGALSVWLRQGEIEATTIACEAWQPDKLRARLQDIRVLSKAKAPAYFLPRLRSLCAECGVAVVFVRAPSGCRASGATRFLQADKAMIIMSFRNLADDQFWFTLFHEIGHLLLHGKSATFVDGEAASTNEKENEANDFASNTLIPVHRQEELRGIRPRSTNVIRFALSVGISPGIVVGQLQHHGVIRRNQLNFLKRYHAWEEILSAAS